MIRRLIDSPGTAVMISHNSIRYTQSAQCFAALQVPEGTRCEHFGAGLDLAKAREDITKDMSGEWLFFVDDDHLFSSDLILKLLRRLDSRPDLDLVAAYTLRRWPPHPSVAGQLQADGTARMLKFNVMGGVWPVDLTGLGGGSIIRRTAFNRVDAPWFTGGRFTEDWTFCERLKQAGGQAAVDLDCVVGHITPMSVWPMRQEDGTWGVSYIPVRDGKNQFTDSIVERIADAEPVAV